MTGLNWAHYFSVEILHICVFIQIAALIFNRPLFHQVLLLLNIYMRVLIDAGRDQMWSGCWWRRNNSLWSLTYTHTHTCACTQTHTHTHTLKHMCNACKHTRTQTYTLQAINVVEHWLSDSGTRHK